MTTLDDKNPVLERGGGGPPKPKVKTWQKAAEDKVKVILHDDFESTKEVLRQSCKTWSWIYPLKGIVYFATHPSLWTPFLSHLPSLLFISGVVLAFTFSVVWIPTMAVAIFLTGPLAIISATISTLTLSSGIIQSIAVTYVLPVPLVDIFDATLVLKGHEVLVKRKREVRATLVGDSQNILGRLGGVVRRPFKMFSVDRALRKLVYMPINMVPVAGPAVSLIMQARAGGGECHERYFDLKGWSDRYTNEYITINNGSYGMFSLVTNLLQVVPFAAILFQYTSAVGAALWAADIETNKVRMNAPDEIHME